MHVCVCDCLFSIDFALFYIHRRSIIFIFVSLAAFDQSHGESGDGCDVYNYLPKSAALCDSPANETMSIRFRATVMSSIPEQIFNSFPALKQLDASDTHLSTIANMHFAELPHLMQLNLSKNSIATIPEHIFDKCTAVEVNLQHNAISVLNTNVFAGLSNLLRLDLSYNNITQLEENVFKPLVNMEELRLEFNRILLIDAKLFEHNAKLRLLYLSNNSIEIIQQKAFEPLKQLESLEMDNNPFQVVNLMAMKRLLNVSVVNCQLTELQIPDSVTHVKAYGNRITHINVSFDSNLTSLMVGKNNLTSLGDLTEHRKLEDLELSYNHITHLNLSTLTRMRQLKNLLIYDIKLDALDAEFVFKQLSNLRVIELSPDLYEADKLKAFATQLEQKHIFLIDEKGRIMTGDPKISNDQSAATSTNAMNKLATSGTTTGPATHDDSRQAKDNIEIILGHERELNDRIQRLERLVQSMTDERRTELQHMESVDHNLHTLRVLTVIVTCAFSLFVALQIFLFVRNNYTRLRIQTSTMLSNGRARSHEPMLEEVL